MTSSSSGRALACVLDPQTLEERSASAYPPHLSKEMVGRFRRGLGTRLGIKNFGVNLLRLAPGAWSSQRHWHRTQDEMIYVVEGEVVLATDDGEQVLAAGMVAGFPKGRADGHHLHNRSGRDALVLEIGDRSPGDEVVYPDVDMAAAMQPLAYAFTRKDGSSF